MQLVQHEQMWELSRNIQAELMQEARKVRMLRDARAPKTPWWVSLWRRWQARERIAIKVNATPELG